MKTRIRFAKSLLHPRFWLLWLGLGLWRLITLLPFQLLLALGRWSGRIMHRYASQRRYFAERNIELCFPELTEQQRADLVLKNFESNGIAFFETGIAWWWPNKRFRKLFRYEGLEHIDNLDGQGALLLALHYTTLEMGASALADLVPMDGMYRANSNPVFDYVQRKGREKRLRGRGKAYPRNDVRTIFKALRNGRFVWYAADQDYGRQHSVFAPFFGVQAASITATGRFAKMGRAAVLPFTHVRLPETQGYLIKVHPPIQNFPTDDEVEDATRINATIEGFVREQPDQYLWIHRRFKTRPEGEDTLYAIKRKLSRSRKRRRAARKSQKVD
jgi:KDO2-lipid IV(A) lauroyltransferase